MKKLLFILICSTVVFFLIEIALQYFYFPKKIESLAIKIEEKVNRIVLYTQATNDSNFECQLDRIISLNLTNSVAKKLNQENLHCAIPTLQYGKNQYKQLSLIIELSDFQTTVNLNSTAPLNTIPKIGRGMFSLIQNRKNINNSTLVGNSTLFQKKYTNYQQWQKDIAKDSLKEIKDLFLKKYAFVLDENNIYLRELKNISVFCKENKIALDVILLPSNFEIAQFLFKNDLKAYMDYNADFIAGFCANEKIQFTDLYNEEDAPAGWLYTQNMTTTPFKTRLKIVEVLKRNETFDFIRTSKLCGWDSLATQKEYLKLKKYYYQK